LRGKKAYNLPFGRFLTGPAKGKFSETTQRVLKMARTTCGLPKLMIFSGGQLMPSQEMYGKALWASFFYQESPLNPSSKKRRFEVSDVYDCNTVVPGQPIRLQKGLGTVQEVTIDYSSRTITINGLI
jgi:hypothetical protein